ncbi:methyl-cpg-binding domain-containing protein 2 [Phtheirospermum japonicum]|uniref:Methyl-cpg-binding domain-containing protein 2 n=1 Tax=Phtheirospermum japonicum TaxID=374723 RepID=A0A830BAK6_9LAMI|nr:methyl-cpg-binding domain-containing protein 2 [Phtheirospermum japonicum]
MAVQQEPNMTIKQVWDSIEMYTVRCSKCLKWRLIPTKEKYEQIRERIDEEPFQCESTREWQKNIYCDDESDVKQDDSLRWAMDKPSIPRTPTGWQRIIRLRAKGGTKFADIYYVSPSNKRIRSMVELERYLAENPNYQAEGVIASRFSFQSPVALDADYVNAKRRGVSASSQDMSGILHSNIVH